MNKKSTKNKMKKKKGGSRGSIVFAIIIILMVLIGVLGLKKYIDNRDEVLLEEFPDKIQKEVNQVKNNSQPYKKVKYKLPEEFNEICILEKREFNLLLKSNSSIKFRKLENIDIKNITKENNEFCIPVEEGEVQMTLIKKENNPKVIIKNE